mgnify:CR=1 FL=1
MGHTGGNTPCEKRPNPGVVLVKMAARLGFGFLCAAALVLSVLDAAAVPIMADVWDKLKHSAGYFCLMLCGDLGFATGRRLATKAAAVFAYGGLLEILQHFLPYRHFSLSDAAANLAGILVFFAGQLLLRQTRLYLMFKGA